jgi:integrase
MRPALPIGTFGAVWTSDGDAPYKARVRFRDYDGVVRTVARWGQTKTAARTALKEALRDRQQHRPDTDGAITPHTTVSKLADAWMAADHDWASNTYETYGYIVANQIKPALGGIRLSELRLAVINRAVGKVRETSGPGSAKTMKAALSGMCQLAIQHEALDSNPVRDVARISHGAKKAVRALTVEEADDLCDRLRTDKRACHLDLPDLVEWMLGTGARIGESIAARDASLDLEAGTWEINATVVRIKGKGLTIQPQPKTAAGWRRLALPPFAVAMVQRRGTELRFRTDERVVFGASLARSLRDPSNTAGDLREVLDMLGFNWVTSHVFRKTVATRLDEAGLSARQIADQLGHKKPSLTQDIYMGRKVVSAEAARILDR